MSQESLLHASLIIHTAALEASKTDSWEGGLPATNRLEKSGAEKSR